MPARPRDWCRRCAGATRTRGSAIAARSRNGLTRAAFRRSQRWVCGRATRSRSGCRAARPRRRWTTSCRWRRATSTSRRSTRHPRRSRLCGRRRSVPPPGWVSGRPTRHDWAPSPSRTPPPRSPRSSGAGSARRSRQSRRSISQLRTRTAREVGEAEASIFDAHQLLLDDAALLDDVRGRIDDGPVRGVRVVGRRAATWPPSSRRCPIRTCRPGPTMSRAVGDQVLRAMLGTGEGCDRAHGRAGGRRPHPGRGRRAGPGPGGGGAAGVRQPDTRTM